MANRSLNKVLLIGNLTRDPELRYTPQGTAVCTLGLATNRQWVTENGEKREDTEFHRLVAWNKLAELCSQLLTKGRKIYVEGRLQTRTWTAADGNQRTTTEIVIDDMIILDSRRMVEPVSTDISAVAATPVTTIAPSQAMSKEEDDKSASKVSPAETGENVKKKSKSAVQKAEEKPAPTKQDSDTINPDDIPF